jgi:hypothetical protein
MIRVPRRARILFVAALGLSACRPKADARPTPVETTPATEQVPPGEDAAITEVRAMLVKFVRDRYGGGKGPARRDAHVKAHGCVRAEVEVHPNLPENLAQGVFAAPTTHRAWIRFSNSADEPQRDKKADGRGMAIKLMGVPGEKLLPGAEHETTQDFVLIDYPEFVVRDAEDYVAFTHDSNAGHPLRFFVKRGAHRLPQLKVAEHLALQKIATPLAPAYYSMTPYLLGEGQAVKYGARPCAPVDDDAKRCGEDFLRWNLAEELAAHGACFDLMVQVQTDPRTMPIEDPTVAWDQSASPYVPVATITIPAQRFDAPDVDQMCEQLSFNPWHALPEHRPLGGINRVRKAVYATISALRHDMNGVRALEPTSWDVAAYLAASRAQPKPGP